MSANTAERQRRWTTYSLNAKPRTATSLVTNQRAVVEEVQYLGPTLTRRRPELRPSEEHNGEYLLTR